MQTRSTCIPANFPMRLDVSALQTNSIPRLPFQTSVQSVQKQKSNSFLIRKTFSLPNQPIISYDNAALRCPPIGPNVGSFPFRGELDVVNDERAMRLLRLPDLIWFGDDAVKREVEGGDRLENPPFVQGLVMVEDLLMLT